MEAGTPPCGPRADSLPIVPFALNREVLLHSRWEPPWKWDSHGWGWILEQLGRGTIFDATTPPALTLLVALGLVAGELCITSFPLCASASAKAKDSPS